MGMPNSLSLQNELTFENDLYGDLVQENFLDSYRNLTYKVPISILLVVQVNYYIYINSIFTHIIKLIFIND